MQLTINGQSQTTEATTVSELITGLGLADRAVAVELNRTIVPRRDHEKSVLRDGDTLEIVTLVGGG